MLHYGHRSSAHGRYRGSALPPCPRRCSFFCRRDRAHQRDAVRTRCRQRALDLAARPRGRARARVRDLWPSVHHSMVDAACGLQSYCRARPRLGYSRVARSVAIVESGRRTRRGVRPILGPFCRAA
eukprot:Amastigsp_a842606_27.p3 type:complete len:126 gc:universal Amastigsp_a842606_27:537-160(-)